MEDVYIKLSHCDDALGPVISRSLVTIHLRISFSCTLFSFVNFAGILPSAVLSWRIMTGEDWHQILRDTMVSGGLGFGVGAWGVTYGWRIGSGGGS